MCDLIWQINANLSYPAFCDVLSFVSILRCPMGPRGPSPNRPSPAGLALGELGEDVWSAYTLGQHLVLVQPWSSRGRNMMSSLFFNLINQYPWNLKNGTRDDTSHFVGYSCKIWLKHVETTRVCPVVKCFDLKSVLIHSISKQKTIKTT